MNTPALKRVKAPSTNAESVDAAVERKATEIRAARIAKAEASLAQAKQDLAEAQRAESTTAQRYSLYAPGPSNPEHTRLVQADEAVRVAERMVSHHTTALATARERLDPRLRAAITTMISSKQKADELRASVEPLVEKLQTEAAALIETLKEIVATNSHELTARTQHMDSAETVGIALPHSAGTVALVDMLTSEAVLKACRAAGFDPWRFSDLTRPATAIGAPHIAAFGERAFIQDSEERDADHERRMNDHVMRQHAEAERNSARLAAQQSPPVRLPGRSLFERSNGRTPVGNGHALSSDRATLVE